MAHSAIGAVRKRWCLITAWSKLVCPSTVSEVELLQMGSCNSTSMCWCAFRCRLIFNEVVETDKKYMRDVTAVSSTRRPKPRVSVFVSCCLLSPIWFVPKAKLICLVQLLLQDWQFCGTAIASWLLDTALPFLSCLSSLDACTGTDHSMLFVYNISLLFEIPYVYMYARFVHFLLCRSNQIGWQNWHHTSTSLAR